MNTDIKSELMFANLAIMVAGSLGMMAAIGLRISLRNALIIIVSLRLFCFIAGMQVSNPTQLESCLFLFDDSKRYLAGANYVAETIPDLTFSLTELRELLDTKNNGESYVICLGLFTLLAGGISGVVISFVFNLITMLITVVTVRQIFLELECDTEAMPAFALIYCLSPVQIWLGSSVLKENFTVLEACLFIFLGLRYLKCPSFGIGVLFAMVSASIMLDRPWLLGVYGVPVAFAGSMYAAERFRSCLEWVGSARRLRVDVRLTRSFFIAASLIVCLILLNHPQVKDRLMLYASGMGGRLLAETSWGDRFWLAPFLTLKLLLVPFPNIYGELTQAPMWGYHTWSISGILLSIPIHVFTVLLFIYALYSRLATTRAPLNAFILAIMPIGMVATLLTPYHYRIREAVMVMPCVLLALVIHRWDSKTKRRVVAAFALFLVVFNAVFSPQWMQVLH